MHEHDYEIIMGLAEGTLDDAAAENAAADIAACAECTADLELQRVALSALNDAPEVYLTASESAELHASLKRDLSIAAPTPAVAKSRVAWGRWVGVLGAAAAVVFFFAIVPAMMGGIGFSGDDSSEDFAATETTAAATQEMAEAPAMATTADDGALDESAEESESLAGGADVAEAPATTEAAAETTTTINALRMVTDTLTSLGPLQELDRAALLDQIAADPEFFLELTDDAKTADPSFATCLVEATSPDLAVEYGLPADSDPLVLGTVLDTATGEELVLVAYPQEPSSETAFTTYRAFGCELVEVLP